MSPEDDCGRTSARHYRRDGAATVSAGFVLRRARASVHPCSAKIRCVGTRHRVRVRRSGRFVAEESASRRSRAPRADTRAARATLSALCVSLKYAESIKSPECTRAKHGHFVAEPGATSPKKARSGGTRRRGSSSCTDANAGYLPPTRLQRSKRRVLLDLTRQRLRALAGPGEAGTFSNRAGEASCTSCPAGSSSEAGSTRCASADGTAKPAAGSGECTSCEPGRFATRRARASASLRRRVFRGKVGAFDQKQCLPAPTPGRRRRGVHPLRGRAVRL